MSAAMRQPSLLSNREVHSAATSPSRRRLPPWLRSDKTKIIGSVVLLLIAAVILYSSLSGEDAAASTKKRLAIDSESGRTFEVRIIEGERFPWANPETGERTLYPAEACFWTRDGKAKLEPTYVFVKAYLGSRDKTVCPDCGREVRQHNPLPPDELMARAAEEKAGGGSK